MDLDTFTLASLTFDDVFTLGAIGTALVSTYVLAFLDLRASMRRRAVLDAHAFKVATSAADAREQASRRALPVGAVKVRVATRYPGTWPRPSHVSPRVLDMSERASATWAWRTAD